MSQFSSNTVVVDRNRTNVVPVSLGIDVSEDIIKSQIRTKDSQTSTLIATWVVTFATDGTDGEIILTLPHTTVSAITDKTGYMDLLRISNGQPLSVFEKPLPVEFQGTVTTVTP